MSVMALLALVTPAIYLTMLTAEALWPRRRYRPIRGWRVLGICFLLLNAFLSTLTPMLLPMAWLLDHQLFDNRGLGVLGGAVVGFLSVSFTLYLWHRACHASPLMWRMFHQLHHGPDRVDISSAVLAHPFDTVARTTLSILITVFVLGLDRRAAGLAGLVLGVYSLFPHWNVRTPRALQYLIQRPEAHLLHHERDRHSGNYGDFPLWDLLFGSFRHPDVEPAELGFTAPANGRLLSMLVFLDVNRTPGGREAPRNVPGGKSI